MTTRKRERVNQDLRPAHTRIAPLRASADGHFLVEDDGTPFFWLADTAWELFHRLDRDDTLRYLDDRAAKGYNVIQAVAHGGIMEGWSTRPNRYGRPPFVDGDPLRPDPDFFDHVEWAVERAHERGIRTALLPVWSSSAVYPDAAIHLGNAETYGRWIGERYARQGIIWVLGGDLTPIWRSPAGEAVDYRPVFDALAAGILAGAGGDAFLTYHPSVGALLEAPPARMSLYFGDRSWLALNMLQSCHLDRDEVDEYGGERGADLTPHFGGDRRPSYVWSGPYNHLPVRAEYDSTPTRPVIDAEPCYEDHPRFRTDPRDNGIWRADDVRRAAYHAVFAGAAGHTYGHVSVWDFYGAGGVREESWIFPDGFARPLWHDALDAPGAGQMRHLAALILSRPYFSRIPDDEVVVGDNPAGAAYVGATRAADGSYALVYAPFGGSVTVDLDRLAGPVRASWFDPRTGCTEPSGEAAATGIRSFVAPTSGADSDWVLVLDAVPGEAVRP